MLLAAGMVVTLPGVGAFAASSLNSADEPVEAQKDGDDSFDEPDTDSEGFGIFQTGTERFSVIPGETVNLQVFPDPESEFTPASDSIEYSWYLNVESWDAESGEWITDKMYFDDADEDSYRFVYDESYHGTQLVTCQIRYRLDVKEDEAHYGEIFKEQVNFEIDDSMCPINVLPDEDRDLQANKGEEVTLACETSINEESGAAGYIADIEKATFQWYKLTDDGDITVQGATSSSMKTTVTDEEKKFYCKVTVPVTKDKGTEYEQNLSYTVLSGLFDVHKHILFSKGYEQDTYMALPGEKVTLSVDTQYTEFTESLIEKGYAPTWSYQWYVIDTNDFDEEVRRTCNCLKKDCDVVVQDIVTTYTCDVTLTLKKDNDVYSQTITDMYCDVQPEIPFEVYTNEDLMDTESTLFELPGYETTLFAYPSPMTREVMDNGEVVGTEPKYTIDAYSYQWESGYFVKEQGEEVLKWKPIEGKTKNTLDITVKNDDDYEGYRCAVTGVVDLGPANEYRFTNYVTYEVKVCCPMYLTISADEEYYSMDEEVTLRADVSLSEEETDYYGYEFDQEKHPFTYQWEVFHEDGQWEKISNATGETLKHIVDDSSIRFKVSGVATKDEQECQFTYKSDEFYLGPQIPVELNIFADKDDQKIMISSGETSYPYGSKTVLRTEVNYDEEVVTDLFVRSYQWYLYDDSKKDFVKLDGETKENITVNVSKKMSYRCLISVTVTVAGTKRDFAVMSDCDVSVSNDSSVFIVAKDTLGKPVTATTKGQIRLYALFFGENVTGYKVQWSYLDSTAEGYIDISGATDLSYLVDSANAKECYSVSIIDFYGNEIREDYILPSYRNNALTQEKRSQSTKKLSVGKNLVKGIGDSDIAQKVHPEDIYTFIPEKTGVCRFYSSAAKTPVGPIEGEGEAVDPFIVFYDTDGLFEKKDDDLQSGAECYNFDTTYYVQKGLPCYCVFGRENEEYYVNIEYLNVNHVHAYDPGTGTCLICGEKEELHSDGTENKTQTQTQTQTTPQTQTKQELIAKKVGEKIALKKQGTFEVTKATAGKQEVSFVKPADKKAKTIKVPATIKENGVTYKVTKIDPKALRNNKYVKTIEIGKNVSKLTNGLFNGCSKLKTVKIQGKKTKFGNKLFDKKCKNLKTINLGSLKYTKNTFSKNTFKGMKGKVTIQVKSSPAAFKNVEKAIKKAGAAKTTKVKRVK